MWNQLSMLDNPEEQEAIRDVYALLGRVAVLFAKLEAYVTDILGTLVHPNNDLLTATLTENLGFHKKLELIKKVGRFRSNKESELNQLVADASSVRRQRNEFIHGIWEIDTDERGQVLARCQVRRIKFEKRGDEKKWRHSRTRRVKADELLVLAHKLVEMCNLSAKLAEELKDDEDLLLD